jgi:hypothetical protein
MMMSKKANNIGKLIVELLLESVIIVERNNFKGVVFTYGGEIICCINYLNEFMMLREIYDKLNSRLTLEAKREIIVTTFMGYEIKIVKEDAFRKYLRPTTKPYFLHEDWIL